MTLALADQARSSRTATEKRTKPQRFAASSALEGELAQGWKR